MSSNKDIEQELRESVQQYGESCVKATKRFISGEIDEKTRDEIYRGAALELESDLKRRESKARTEAKREGVKFGARFVASQYHPATDDGEKRIERLAEEAVERLNEVEGK